VPDRADELTVLRAREGLAWQIVDGEAVVVDVDRGQMLGLNRSAARLWLLLPARSADDLAQALVADFATDLDTARRDARAFVDALLGLGLLAT
jgi:hypothetical protein